jgi:hypothetical protein
VVVIGIFELIHLGTFTKETQNHLPSPFANDRMECAIPFTKEEEQDLFAQFVKQEYLEVEQGLVEEIHEFTRG